METFLSEFARVSSLLVEAAAVLVVAFGSLDAFVRLIPIVATPRASHGARKAIWRRFGMWLVLGLEFELAADIIRSVMSPTWLDIAELGAIALIRTFLNYFLEKDLELADASGEEQQRVHAGSNRPGHALRPADVSRN